MAGDMSPEYCPRRKDEQHCNCWYDGAPCCGCGDNTPQPGDDLTTYAAGAGMTADDREVTTAPTVETCALCGADRTSVALALSSKSGFKRYVCASPSGCRRRREQNAALAGAEARGVERGYRRAVERLRDDDGFRAWFGDGAIPRVWNLDRRDRETAAAYLEAVEGDDRADTQ